MGENSERPGRTGGVHTTLDYAPLERRGFLAPALLVLIVACGCLPAVVLMWRERSVSVTVLITWPVSAVLSMVVAIAYPRAGRCYARSWRWLAAVPGITSLLLFGVLVLASASYLRGSQEPVGWRRCRDRLRVLSEALEQYKQDHGTYPQSLRQLPRGGDTDDDWQQCPRCTESTRPSYVYLPPDVRGTANIIVCEPLCNHDGLGSFAILGNGTVQWLSAAEAGKRLEPLIQQARRASDATQ